MLEYQRNNHKRGFTVIEIILAILIISLVIVGVLMFFPTSRRATEESALKTRIANSVISEVEAIKAVGYKDLRRLLEYTGEIQNKLLIELFLKENIEKIYYDKNDNNVFDGGDIEISDTSIFDRLKINNWKSLLSELGIEKGVIEIRTVEGIDNLISIKVRAEYGFGKSYEINTYISL